MKKIFTTISLIILVAVVATTLFACSSATTQGQLQNILNDHKHESFTYTVYSASKDANGAYTQKTEQHSGSYTVTLDAYDSGKELELTRLDNHHSGKRHSCHRHTLCRHDRI